jgi:hypothetical protein
MVWVGELGRITYIQPCVCVCACVCVCVCVCVDNIYIRVYIFM